MAFLVSQKPPSSSSSSASSLTSTYGDKNQLPASGSPVTSCLYLKPDAEGSGAGERKPLDRDVVLRRIRHRKRVNQIRTALDSLRELEPGVDKGGEPHAWLDDAFSSP